MPAIHSVTAAFAAAVAAAPSAPALVWGRAGATSFAALDGASNQAARLLLARGIRKGDTVCLSLEKSELAYALAIGCLKVGAPYFFVDPANPEPRTRAMAARCAASIAFIAPAAPASAFTCPVVSVPDEAPPASVFAGHDEAPPAVPWRVLSDDPAYVMFTSGSTGEPKGATISHGNLQHFLAWTRARLRTRPSDVFSGVNPLFFDNSVFDLFASVFAGAALAPVAQAALRLPQAVLDHLAAAGCTIFFSVPSLLVYLQNLKLVDEHAFPTCRTMLFGGEGYPKPMLAALFAALGSRIELLNVYGPTECTCICSAYRVTAPDVEGPGYVPLGTLNPGYTHAIVDDTGRAVTAGETGELWLGGPAVGLGYYRDPAQTARAFAQNPTHNRYADRMYRTGDLVREDRATGLLHFAGRADTQIKHRGYRIELGEIEHALAAVPGVGEAAAVYLPGGAGRIVGVIAAGTPLQAAEVKAALGRALPAYMVPERIVVTAALPKNANGKIDRRSIRAVLEEGGDV